MSNRTDFDEQAVELAQLFGFSDHARSRIATELHNAFVAGQETEGRRAGELKLHVPDCPMTNERAAARTVCVCEHWEGTPRDTPEGKGS